MALVIGVTKGSRIRVDDSMLTVLQIMSDSAVLLHIADGNLDKEFLVTEEERTEVIEDVFVSLGRDHNSSGTNSSRLAFEAPLSIRINRLRV